ncbi:host attachment family protein [Minwuia sp.]|uniref:host attachment family protein n=1 Tax=Minwuia sp. TaxID=2493630 RepID=UPI003A927E40
MSSKTIPTDTFIVVGTGEGAKFFRNAGDTQNLDLKPEGALEPGDLADQGPAGKSPPDQSDKESMEATFSKILANDLYDKAHAGKFDQLVLILDPDTLGEVRPLLHKEVQDRLRFDMAKTLVNSTIDDIEKTLNAA